MRLVDYKSPKAPASNEGWGMVSEDGTRWSQAKQYIALHSLTGEALGKVWALRIRARLGQHTSPARFWAWSDNLLDRSPPTSDKLYTTRREASEALAKAINYPL